MEILSITIPIFIFVAAGYVLRQKRILSEETKMFLSKFVYYFAFPAMVFKSIVSFDFDSTFKLNLVAFNLTVTFLIFVITFFIAFMIKDAYKRGAFNMSCFRSNQGYMGLPIVSGFYGQESMSRAAIINGFDSPLVIIISVFALEIYRRGRGENAVGVNSKKAYQIIGNKLLNFIGNPFIISSVLGLALSFFKIPVLKISVINEFLNIASGMALPLALISIGCSIQIKHLKNNIQLVSVATAIKLIGMPILAFFLGYYLFNLRGNDLGLGVILSATPTSVSSYIMACEMDTDAELSATMIGFTTFISIVSISLVQFLLKQYIL